MNSRILAAALPAQVGRRVTDRRLAAPPARAEVSDLPDRQGPVRPGPGRRAQPRRCRSARRRPGWPGRRGQRGPEPPAGGDRDRGRGHGNREPAGTWRRRDHRCGDHRAVRAGRAAAVRPVPPGGQCHAARDPRPRADHAAASPAAGRFRDLRGQRGRIPRRAGWPGLHRGAHTEDRRLRDRVRRQRPSGSTISASPPTWPSRRSSTSKPWWACSSGSTRWARYSGPSRTTPPGTWRSTPASTPSSASSPTTRT